MPLKFTSESEPKQGDDVRKLWRNVVALIAEVKNLRQQIGAKTGRRPLIGGEASSSGLVQFKIVSDGGDYWMAKTWDGTTLGTNLVRLTKPKKLRAGTDAITSETIRGVVHNYTYNSVNIGSVIGYYVRNVTVNGALVERQILIPDMMPNDIIDAMPHSSYGVQLATASVATGGTGYTNGATLTLVGGTGTAATFTAIASGGVLTGVTILDPGNYTTPPSSPAAVSGGGGSSGTISFTTQSGLKAMVDGVTWAEM